MIKTTCLASKQANLMTLCTDVYRHRRDEQLTLLRVSFSCEDQWDQASDRFHRKFGQCHESNECCDRILSRGCFPFSSHSIAPPPSHRLQPLATRGTFQECARMVPPTTQLHDTDTCARMKYRGVNKIDHPR